MPYSMVKCANGCGAEIRNVPGRSGVCANCLRGKPEATPDIPLADQIAADRRHAVAHIEQSGLRKKYHEALKHLAQAEAERDAAFAMADPQPCVIEPKYGSGTSEATVVVLASDWHAEERVDPKRINGLNEFNLDIADERITTFFQATQRLTRLLQQDVKIETLILGMLGDFISGDIHEEVAEVCLLPPMEAIEFVQERVVGGLDFLLEHTTMNLHLKCHVGNHGRTTKTSRFATENGHSLEYLLYRWLATHYRTEPRVTFDIAEGPHSYATVYGKRLRFQHGHMVKYNGGVGGIYIPVNKAINEWNKGLRVDYDFLGHFHQQVDGNNFMVNGPLVGYNAFALSIKAPWDVPKQTLFLLDKKRGKTCVWPILFRR